MKRTLFAIYYTEPPRGDRRRRARTSCRIQEDDARARGLTDIVAGSEQYYDLPETPDELARSGLHGFVGAMVAHNERERGAAAASTPDQVPPSAG